MTAGIGQSTSPRDTAREPDSFVTRGAIALTSTTGLILCFLVLQW